MRDRTAVLGPRPVFSFGHLRDLCKGFGLHHSSPEEQESRTPDDVECFIDIILSVVLKMFFFAIAPFGLGGQSNLLR